MFFNLQGSAPAGQRNLGFESAIFLKILCADVLNVLQLQADREKRYPSAFMSCTLTAPQWRMVVDDLSTRAYEGGRHGTRAGHA